MIELLTINRKLQLEEMLIGLYRNNYYYSIFAGYFCRSINFDRNFSLRWFDFHAPS